MQKYAQRQFFRDLRKWIKDGCPKRNAHKFDPAVGLCINYKAWCFTGNKQHAQKPFHFVGNWPFNLSLSQYYDESKSETMYQNAARLAYIKEHS